MTLERIMRGRLPWKRKEKGSAPPGEGQASRSAAVCPLCGRCIPVSPLVDRCPSCGGDIREQGTALAAGRGAIPHDDSTGTA